MQERTFTMVDWCNDLRKNLEDEIADSVNVKQKRTPVPQFKFDPSENWLRPRTVVVPDEDSPTG